MSGGVWVAASSEAQGRAGAGEDVWDREGGEAQDEDRHAA